MDRDEFMELVYETFADEPDNVLANGIIEAADAYVEHEKAQLSHEGTTKGTTPTIQPIATDTNVGDKISKFIDGLEEIFADIREKHVDDSVCGLCEYDGAYIGQSGNWCNECPGFEKDDCFKLSDKTRKKWTEEIIKALPTIQPEKRTEEHTEMHACDLISRQALCEYALNQKDKSVTPNDIMRFPPAQPEQSIPLSWIEKYIEWLKSFDNEFANLEAAHISVMVKKWMEEQNERTD